MPTENEKYVFISYAHANSDKVLPIINAMRSHGIQAWYDEGIVAGSEWPEFIAEKVVNCTAFVLFVSDAYLVSQNCKRELNFAISRKKQILSVFLEDVQLSPGVEMQLGTYQAIYRNRFADNASFYSSLCQEPFFDICRIVTDTQQSAPPPVALQATPTRPTAPQTTPVQPANGHASSVAAIADRLKETKPVTAIADKLKDTNLSDLQSAFTSKKKNKIVAAVLAFLTGFLGGHYFYLGHYGLAVVCILLLIFRLGSIAFIWGIIQGVRYLLCPDDSFQQKFAKK